MLYPYPLLRIQLPKSVNLDAARSGYLMIHHHLHQYEYYGLNSWSVSIQ
jgi:hypothetical protein